MASARAGSQWEDGMIDEQPIFIWSPIEPSLVSALASRWIAELQSGNPSDVFCSMGALLALQVRDPEDPSRYIFASVIPDNAPMFPGWEQFTDPYNITNYGKKYVRPGEAELINKIQATQNLHIFGPYLALMATRACVQPGKRVVQTMQRNAMGMYFSTYPNFYNVWWLHDLSPRSLKTYRRKFHTGTTLFNTILVSALKIRFGQSSATPLPSKTATLLDFCVITRTEFNGLALVKMAYDMAKGYYMTPKDVLDYIRKECEETKDSNDRVIDFIDKYMSPDNQASIYYKWARNFNNTYFRNLTPKANATLFAVLAQLKSFKNLNGNWSGPINMMAYRVAKANASPNVQKIYESVKKSLSKKSMDQLMKQDMSVKLRRAFLALATEMKLDDIQVKKVNEVDETNELDYPSIPTLMDNMELKDVIGLMGEMQLDETKVNEMMGLMDDDDADWNDADFW